MHVVAYLLQQVPTHHERLTHIPRLKELGNYWWQSRPVFSHGFIVCAAGICCSIGRTSNIV
jgi:hypothetical protein